jgi:hypothetical protein
MLAYCRPSGIMVSPAPGQFTPTYVTFSPLVLRIQRPSVARGP